MLVAGRDAGEEVGTLRSGGDALLDVVQAGPRTARQHQARGCRTNPSDQECHDRNMASTCAQSDDSQFAAAWAKGRAMPLEQAIEYALAAEYSER